MSRNTEGGASPHSRDGIPDLKYGVDEGRESQDGRNWHMFLTACHTSRSAKRGTDRPSISVDTGQQTLSITHFSRAG